MEYFNNGSVITGEGKAPLSDDEFISLLGYNPPPVEAQPDQPKKESYAPAGEDLKDLYAFAVRENSTPEWAERLGKSSLSVTAENWKGDENDKLGMGQRLASSLLGRDLAADPSAYWRLQGKEAPEFETKQQAYREMYDDWSTEAVRRNNDEINHRKLLKANEEERDSYISAYIQDNDGLRWENTAAKMARMRRILPPEIDPQKTQDTIDRAAAGYDLVAKNEASYLEKNTETFAVSLLEALSVKDENGEMKLDEAALNLFLGEASEAMQRESEKGGSHFWRNFGTNFATKLSDAINAADALANSVEYHDPRETLDVTNRAVSAVAYRPASREDEIFRKNFEEGKKKFAKNKEALRKLMGQARKLGEIGMQPTAKGNFTGSAVSMLGSIAGDSAVMLIPYVGKPLMFASSIYSAQNTALAEGEKNPYLEGILNGTTDAAVEFSFGIGKLGRLSRLGDLIGKVPAAKLATGKISDVTRYINGKAFARGSTHAVLGFGEETILEPLVGETANYWGRNALNAMGAELEDKEWKALEQIQGSLTDGVQATATGAFVGIMSLAYGRHFSRQAQEYRKDIDTLKAAGLTERHAGEIASATHEAEKSKELIKQYIKEDVLLDPSGAVQRMEDAGQKLMEKQEAQLYRASGAIQDVLKIQGVEITDKADGEYEVLVRDKDGEETQRVTMNEEQVDDFIRTVTADESVNYARQIQDLIAADALVESANKTDSMEFRDMGAETAPGTYREATQKAGGMTLEGFRAMSKQAVERMNQLQREKGVTLEEARAMTDDTIMKDVKLGNIADLATSFEERGRMGVRTGEITQKQYEEGSYHTGIHRLPSASKLGGSVLMFARGNVTTRQVMEDVMESSLADYMAKTGKDWNALGEHLVAADKELQKYGVTLGSPKNGEKVTKQDVIEMFSNLAQADWIMKVKDWNLPDWVKALVRFVMKMLDDAGTIIKLGEAWAEFVNTPEGKAYIEEHGSLVDILDAVGADTATIFSNAKIDAGRAAALKRLIEDRRLMRDKADGRQTNTEVEASLEEMEKQDKELEQIEKALADDDSEIPEEENVPPASQSVQPVELMEDGTAQAVGEEAEHDEQTGAGLVDNAYQRVADDCIFGHVEVGALKLAPDVEQFKHGKKNSRGAIEGKELSGKYRQDAPPISVWRRKNGELHIITGRHRFDLATRDGVKSIPAYIYPEDATHDATWAKLHDVGHNMLDGQASALEVAYFVKNSGLSRAEMESQGYLRPGSANVMGFEIATKASEEVFTRLKNGAISDQDAYRICLISNTEQGQMLALQLRGKGKSWDYVSAYIREADRVKSRKESEGLQFDLFGADTAWRDDCEKIASYVQACLRRIGERLSLLKGARGITKKESLAKKLGVEIKTESDVEQEIERMAALKLAYEEHDGSLSIHAKARDWDSKSEVDPFSDIIRPDSTFSASISPNRTPLEIAEAFHKVERMEPIEVNAHEVYITESKTAVELAKAEYKKLQKETMEKGFSFIMSDGRKVGASGKGIREISRHSADRRNIAVVYALKNLCLGAQYIHSSPNSEKDTPSKKDIVSYHYYFTKGRFHGYVEHERNNRGNKFIEDNDRDAYISIVVSEYKNGDMFYDVSAQSVDAINKNRDISKVLQDTRVSRPGQEGDMPRKTRIQLLKEYVNYVDNDPLTASAEKRNAMTPDEVKAQGLFKNGALEAENGIITEPGESFSITAKHVSLYSFRKFDTSQVGTGEGRQAFGWGVYFLTNDSVREYYSRKLGEMGKSEGIAQYVVELNAGELDLMRWEYMDDATMRKLNQSPIEEVRYMADREPESGRQAYRDLTESFWDGDDDTRTEAMKQASAALRQSGIKGIQYEDATSRNSMVGKTFNYVIFDAGDIKITKVNDAETGYDWQEYNDQSASFSLSSIQRNAFDVLNTKIKEQRVLVLKNGIGKELERWRRINAGEKGTLQPGAASESLGAVTAIVSEIRRALPEGYRFAVEPYMRMAERYAQMVEKGEVKATDTITERFVKKLTREAQPYNTDGMGILPEKDVTAEEFIAKMGATRLDELVTKMLERTLTQVDKYLKKQIIDSLVTKVNSLWPKRKPNGKMQGGKMSAEGYKRLRVMYSLMLSEADSKMQRMSDLEGMIEKELKQESPDISRVEELQTELQDWSVFGDIKGMSLAQCRTCATEALKYIQTERIAWKEKLEKDRGEIKYDAKEIVSSLGDSNAQAYRDTKEKAKTGLWEKIKDLPNGIKSFSQAVFAMAHVKGLEDVMNGTLRDISRANVKMRNMKNTRLEEVEKLVAGSINARKKSDVRKWMVDFKRTKNSGIALRPTYTRKLVLTIEEAREWVNMKAGERKKRRAEMEKEAKGKRTVNEKIVYEDDITHLNVELAKLDAGQSRIKKNVTISYEARNTRKDVENLRISRAQAMYAILLGEQKEYASNLASEGIGEKQMEQLRKFVGAEGLAVGYGLRSILAKRGKELAEVYEAREGVPFPAVENYFRAAFRNNHRMNEVTFGEGTGALGGGKYGMLITRRKHNLNLAWDMDCFAVFSAASAETDNYICTNHITKRWRSLLSDREVADSMTNYLGNYGMQRIKNWMDIIDGAGMADGAAYLSQGHLVSMFQSAKAVSLLSWNTLTMAKQLSAIFHGGLTGEISMGTLIGEMLHLRSGKAQMTIGKMMQTEAFRARANNHEILDELMGRASDQNYSGAVRFSMAGMNAINKMDIWSNAVSMTALYNAKWKELQKQNANSDAPMTAEEMDMECMQAVERSLELAAQPLTRTQKSHWGTSGHFLFKLMCFMGSESLNKFGMLFSLIQSRKYAAAFNALVAMSFAEQTVIALYHALTDDDEQWEKNGGFLGAMTGTPVAMLGGVPVIGGAIESTYRGLTGQKVYVGTSSAVIDYGGIIRMFKKNAKAISGEKEYGWNDWAKLIIDDTKALGMTLGAGKGSTVKGIDSMASWLLSLSAAGNIGKTAVKTAEGTGITEEND